MNKYLKAVITLVLVVTISTVLVWGVNSITEPIITERSNKGAAEAYYALVDDTDASGKDVTKDYSGLDAAGIKSIMKLTLSDGTIAYGMQVETTGYHSGLVYATAVNMETKTFYGISIISNEETAGYGKTLLQETAFLDYFKNLSLESSINAADASTDMTAVASKTTKGMTTSINAVAQFALNNLGGEA